jgi:hypothetical protein
MVLINAADSHPLIVPRVRHYLSEVLKVSDDQRIAWIQHWLGVGLQAMEALLADHPLLCRVGIGKSRDSHAGVIDAHDTRIGVERKREGLGRRHLSGFGGPIKPDYLTDRLGANLDGMLLYAAKALDGLTPENNDQKVGIDIVRRALQSPVRQVVENAGGDGSIVVGKLLDVNDPNRGFDAQTGDYVDMVKAGIIDPTKVVRLALQNAASIAGLLVTTEAMVAEKPEKKTPPAMPPGGMGGMDEF